jgi:hypothetical protein
MRLEQRKAVQRELAEGFRQPRQRFHARGRLGQIGGKDLRQLAGNVTGNQTVPRGPGPDKYEENTCITGRYFIPPWGRGTRERRCRDCGRRSQPGGPEGSATRRSASISLLELGIYRPPTRRMGDDPSVVEFEWRFDSHLVRRPPCDYQLGASHLIAASGARCAAINGSIAP